MDPKTVIIMLAVNLIFSGVLYHLIARGLPAGSGLNYWAAGATLFGLAYVGRLAWVLPDAHPGALALDLLMAMSAVLFLLGIRQWLDHAPVRLRWLAALAGVYSVLHVIAVLAWSGTGRFVLLNLALSAVYAGIAINGIVKRGEQVKAIRLPLSLLAALMTGLSVLTLLRAALIAQMGVATMSVGLHAQIYYGYASLSVVLMELTLLWMVFEQLNGKLLDMATRDPLTGVLNRRGLDDALAQYFAARNAQGMTLLEVDIDHFKQVNDEFGHATGDLVLRAVANVLALRVRGDDFVARVGGEEFVVGCAGGDPEVALQLGERLRTSVAALQMPVGLSDRSGALATLPKCTVSVGVSGPFTDLAARSRAMREADAALYAAKGRGRNVVVPFEESLLLNPGTLPVPLFQT